MKPKYNIIEQIFELRDCRISESKFFQEMVVLVVS